MNKDKICGTCRWHSFENWTDGFVCVCNKSDNCADWTDYNDGCEEWEEKI